MSDYPPGIDPAFVAMARREVETLRDQLSASSARNADLRNQLNQAQPADDVTRGQVQEVVSDARSALLLGVWMAVGLAGHIAIDGDLAGAGLFLLIASFWIRPGLRHWRALKAIDTAMKETR